MKRRAHVLISGRVQGVFFRAHTRQVARELRLTGYVSNLPDGRVEAVFEGEDDAVKRAIEWCRRGPPRARVDHVEVRWEEARGDYRDFAIRRD
jgi:acylphosphatase